MTGPIILTNWAFRVLMQGGHQIAELKQVVSDVKQLGYIRWGEGWKK